MDTGYPALIADPPNANNAQKVPTADFEENQAMMPNSEPTGTPPTKLPSK